MGFDEEARKLLDDVKNQAGENKTSDALRVAMVHVMVENDEEEMGEVIPPIVAEEKRTLAPTPLF